MTIERVAGAVATAAPKAFQGGQGRSLVSSKVGAAPQRSPAASVEGRGEGVQPCARVEAAKVSERCPSAARARPLTTAVERVAQAQARLDRVLALARSGKSFTAAELLALQADVYRASQEIDLAGKVVERGTSGLKQVLQTQV